MKLVAVTACATGIAHTYMAAEQLEKTAKALGHQIKVETQGAMGIENELSAADIRQAQAAIFAADIEVEGSRTLRGCKAHSGPGAGSHQRSERRHRKGPGVNCRERATGITALEFEFECKLPNGLHARPASHLAEVANQFSSNSSLTNLRNWRCGRSQKRTRHHRDRCASRRSLRATHAGRRPGRGGRCAPQLHRQRPSRVR